MNMPNLASLNQSGTLYFFKDSQLAWYLSCASSGQIKTIEQTSIAKNKIIFFLCIVSICNRSSKPQNPDWNLSRTRAPAGPSDFSSGNIFKTADNASPLT